MGESSGSAPEEGGQDFRDIVKMSGDSPPTGGKKKVLFGFTTDGVGSFDQDRLLPPDFTATVGFSNMLTLVIGPIVEEDGDGAKNEKERGQEET